MRPSTAANEHADTNGSKLYIASPSDHHPDANSGHASVARDNDKPSSPTQHQDTYSMEVEDTPHRIYINDLDDELADDAEPSTPARPIFMPDIEKHLLGVPMAVFKPSGEEEAARREREKAMQMVVYGVPTSLSVSEEEDNVRRAIEDARRRVRQKMPLGQYHPSPSTIHLPISQPLPTSSSTPSNYNFDMMDET